MFLDYQAAAREAQLLERCPELACAGGCGHAVPESPFCLDGDFFCDRCALSLTAAVVAGVFSSSSAPMGAR